MEWRLGDCWLFDFLFYTFPDSQKMRSLWNFLVLVWEIIPVHSEKKGDVTKLSLTMLNPAVLKMGIVIARYMSSTLYINSTLHCKSREYTGLWGSLNPCPIKIWSTMWATVNYAHTITFSTTSHIICNVGIVKLDNYDVFFPCKKHFRIAWN